MKTHLITGWILLGFGFVTIVYPSVFAKYYGVGLDDPAARALIQSMVGGTEIAVGSSLLFARRLEFDIPTLLGLCSIILLTIATIRFATVIFLDIDSALHVIEGVVEFLGAILLRSKAKQYKTGEEA